MNFADGGLFDAQPNVNCSKVVFVMPLQIALYNNLYNVESCVNVLYSDSFICIPSLVFKSEAVFKI